MRHRMRAWIDLLLMSLTFFLTIIWNVEIGIAVSVVISLLLVVRRSSRPRMTILVCMPPTDSVCTCRSSVTDGGIRCRAFGVRSVVLGVRDADTDVWQGRIPGTDRWKPIDDNPEAEEDASGVLIVRIRENLDFGTCLPRRSVNDTRSYFWLSPSSPTSAANTAQLKGACLQMAAILSLFFEVGRSLTDWDMIIMGASCRTSAAPGAVRT